MGVGSGVIVGVGVAVGRGVGVTSGSTVGFALFFGLCSCFSSAFPAPSYVPSSGVYTEFASLPAYAGIWLWLCEGTLSGCLPESTNTISTYLSLYAQPENTSSPAAMQKYKITAFLKLIISVPDKCGKMMNKSTCHVNVIYMI